eukprot:2704627-Rhodomonas_salina.1
MSLIPSKLGSTGTLSSRDSSFLLGTLVGHLECLWFCLTWRAVKLKDLARDRQYRRYGACSGGLSP